MITVSAIVEGEGEVAALPVLLRRLHGWLTPDLPVQVDNRPIRVPRSRLLKFDDDFRRHLLLAEKKCGSSGWVLVLIDSDDDCPVELGERIRQQAARVLSRVPVGVVLAHREYEAWFLAAAESLQGKRRLDFTAADLEVEAEGVRDAKGWLRLRRTPRQYDPVQDQPALSQHMDLDQAHARSRSFRKLCTEWCRLTRDMFDPSPALDH